MIQIKRVYEDAKRGDGDRFLVDRLWPRGVKKESLAMKAWVKDVAPSNELRHWYHHDIGRWEEFCDRYFAELEEAPDAWRPLLDAARAGSVTLLYSAHQVENNNAVALKQFLEKKLRKKRS